jgi:transposase-like protein
MKNQKTSAELEKSLSQVIKIDEAQIHSHLDAMVRDTVEQTLNTMLSEEADRLCNAQRYEHSDSRKDTRAGHYGRRLHVKAGMVNLKVPKLRKTTFETAIHAQEDRPEALLKAESVAVKLESMRLSKAASTVRAGVAETLSYYDFPREHWLRIRTNNMLERVMREILRRTRVVGCFPDGHSALMLAAARLRHMAGTKWSTCRYLNMKRLQEQRKEQEPGQAKAAG